MGLTNNKTNYDKMFREIVEIQRNVPDIQREYSTVTKETIFDDFWCGVT